MERTANVIAEMMLDLGVMPHLSGYVPLLEGIRVLASADRTRRIPYREITEWIDALYGAADSAHAMRDAIARGTAETAAGCGTLFLHAPQPGNKEFLYSVAEIVRDRVGTDCPHQNTAD